MVATPLVMLIIPRITSPNYFTVLNSGNFSALSQLIKNIELKPGVYFNVYSKPGMDDLILLPNGETFEINHAQWVICG